MTLRLLDLFCCQGGGARGYADAGFDVEGVDVVAQPLYPHRFHLADALTFPLDGYDVVHASPPCQSYSNMSNRYGSAELELIAAVRERLVGHGVPFVIENVCGARPHMVDPILLHGGMFGLPLWRPRLFESSLPLVAPSPAPRPRDAVAVYGRREDRRRLWTRKDGTELRAASLAEARAAMGMPWADWQGVREAIPPAYTEHLGRQLVELLAVEGAA